MGYLRHRRNAFRSFYPPSIPGCNLWLDASQLRLADDGAVALWQDSSHEANNAVQATADYKPVFKTDVINGLPVVRFDGSADFMSTSYAAVDVFTAFLVAKINTIVSDNSQIFCGSSSTDHRCYIGKNSSHQYSAGIGDKNFNTYGGTVYGTTAFRVTSTIANAGDIDGYLGGVSDFDSTYGSTGVAGVDWNIGALNNNGTDSTWLNGDIAEVIVYNAALSDTDRETVELYLKNKYALLAELIDSYSETNQSVGFYNYNEIGQALTLASAKTLTSVKFYLKKDGSPTGNAVAKIYAATGTVGTDAVPTGSALATSGTFDMSTLTTSYQLIEFTFSGGYSASAQGYCVVLDFDSLDGSGNYVYVGTDNTSPTHSGNLVWYISSAWSARPDNDAIFYLYGY